MQLPSSPWAIIGLIVLALVAVYVFQNIVLPLIKTIT